MKRKNKKNLIKLFIVTFIAGLVYTTISNSYFDRVCNNTHHKNNIFNRHTISGILKNSEPLYPDYITTPEDIQSWLKSFKYQEDIDGYWKSPEETVNDNGGDCEDFATLVAHILNNLNYDNYMVAVYYTENKEKFGHAICLFEERDGTWSYFSNTNYIKARKEYLLKPIYLYFPNWYKIIFYSEEGYKIKIIYRENFERKYNEDN